MVVKLEVVTAREDAMDAFQKLASKDMRQIPVVQAGYSALAAGTLRNDAQLK